jgi:hypothetical protein
MEQTNSTKIIRSVNTAKYNFTPISNNLLRDKRITLEARALVSFILSLPENWVIYKIWVQKELGLGRYQFDRIWKECVDAGYIKTNKWKTKDGKFQYYHEITDSLAVVDSSDVGKPDVGKADVGKPNAIIKKEEEKIYEEKIDILNKQVSTSTRITFIDYCNTNNLTPTSELALLYSTNQI